MPLPMDSYGIDVMNAADPSSKTESSPTKVEDQKSEQKPESPDSEENLLSVEDLDKLISQESPGLTRALEDLQNEKLEVQFDTLNPETMLDLVESQSFKGRLRRALFLLKAKARLSLQTLGQTLQTGAQWCWKRLKDLGGFLKESLSSFKDFFSSLKVKQKILFLSLLVLMGLTSFYVFKMLTTGWLHEAPPPFLASLESWASPDGIYEYDPQEVEPFYDSSRTTQNLFKLKKMVVNIRASESSGSNPMAAIEFFVEGNSLEAIVEVKDRESEVRDLFQRDIEEYSYDQLTSSEGKRSLRERLKRSLNQTLTEGRIRNVFINDVILKP